MSETVLVVAVPPFEHAHRAAKIARSYAKRGPTAYLGLSAAGRSAPRSEPGHWRRGNLTIAQVRSRPASDRFGAVTPFVNLALSYVPALARLAVAVIRQPASVVHVNGPYLLPLGLAHKWRYHSVLVAEVDERPGSAQQSRSVTLLVRPFEPLMMRIAARHVDLVVTVTPPHRAMLERDFNFPHHVVVRNAPELVMRGTFVPPPPLSGREPVIFATASSIFEGRCFEMLIDACALLTEQGAGVKVNVAGYGRPEYVASLKALVADRGVEDMITFTGPVAQDEVHRVYAAAHVGLSLYEPEFRHNDSLPNKVLECVSFGRPVLATGQPDVVTFIEATGTGWLAQSSPAGIADAMASIEAKLRVAAIDLPAMAVHCRALGEDEINWEHEFGPVIAFVGLAEAHEPDSSLRTA